MITWREYYVEDYQYQSRLDEANRERMYRLVAPKSSRLTNGFRAGVVRVGAWLETQGCRLQNRYAANPDAQIHMRSANQKAVGSC